MLWSFVHVIRLYQWSTLSVRSFHGLRSLRFVLPSRSIEDAQLKLALSWAHFHWASLWTQCSFWAGSSAHHFFLRVVSNGFKVIQDAALSLEAFNGILLGFFQGETAMTRSAVSRSAIHGEDVIINLWLHIWMLVLILLHIDSHSLLGKSRRGICESLSFLTSNLEEAAADAEKKEKRYACYNTNDDVFTSIIWNEWFRSLILWLSHLVATRWNRILIHIKCW